MELKLPFPASCPGDRIKVKYSPVVNDNGTIDLIPAGKQDLQELYNSQAAGCDMHLIVSRYLAGDTSVLERVQGFYGDVSQLPRNNAELLQRVIDGERMFDQLPKDVKAAFDNDFRKWFATAGTDEWSKVMQSASSAAPAPAASEAPPAADAAPDPSLA